MEKKAVVMNMTGDEFKELIEGRTKDGEIKTIPEVIDAMRGISDDTTVKEDVEEETEENTPERVSEEDLDNFDI